RLVLHLPVAFVLAATLAWSIAGLAPLAAEGGSP
ncbi:MAG: hypothetical protein RIS86_1467, partial [Planctomycetota bacterium]